MQMIKIGVKIKSIDKTYIEQDQVSGIVSPQFNCHNRKSIVEFRKTNQLSFYAVAV